MNTHITYHVDKALQSKHASLIDRRTNGSLAGSDVRILSKSTRKCNVTNIHHHDMPDLDIVQGAALVQTQHGFVSLVMNKYAYSGQGPTIHSSGQIEWHNNYVDDTSTQVGRTQVIITYGGYILPLTSREGLMYVEFLGKPMIDDLVKYPSVHLTSPHPWFPTRVDAPYRSLITDGGDHGSPTGPLEGSQPNLLLTGVPHGFLQIQR